MDILPSSQGSHADGYKNSKSKTANFKKPIHSIKSYLAKHYAKLYSKDLFIGIGGNYDSPIYVETVTEVLSQKFTTLKTENKIDPIFSIPKILLKITPKIEKIVLNMETHLEDEMDAYLSLVKPRVVIMTRINLVHSDVFINTDNLVKEVSKLIHQLPSDGTVVLNWEDSNSKKIVEGFPGNIVYYGNDSQNCTVWAGNIKIEQFRTTFELNQGVERVKVSLQLLGVDKVYPALAAATLGVLYKIPLTKIKIGLEKIPPQDHDLQPLFGPNGSIILDDTSRCLLPDLQSAIDTMLKIPAKRRILVLGEMKGLGNISESIHRQAAQIIYKEKFDQIFLGGGDANIIADELKNLGFWDERMQSNLQNSQLVGLLLQNLGRGDLCLIKGSQAVRLDEVVKRITKKT